MTSARSLGLSVLLLAGLALGPAGSVRSGQDTWAVARMSGSATITLPGAAPQAMIPGMFVPLGSRIATEASGRVLLQRGSTSMMVSPATVVEVIDGAGMMRVVEHRGVIELEVEKRGAPYFNVQTPLLSAVVKGTRFTVTSTTRGNAVAVDRGLVQVTDRASGQSADVPAGQAAASSHAAGGGLSVGPASALDRAAGQFTASATPAPAAAPSSAATTSPSPSTPKGNVGGGTPSSDPVKTDPPADQGQVNPQVQTQGDLTKVQSQSQTQTQTGWGDRQKRDDDGDRENRSGDRRSRDRERD